MGGLLQAEGGTMQELAPQQRQSYRLDEIARDAQLKQSLDSLERENDQLKQLIVRLSETIIRLVTSNR